MKNLKKVLALVLAFACAFTMFAGAAFTDQADIESSDAVDTLVALGVIEGYTDGSFRPETTVTRAEMAKMIYTILNGGNDDASAYENLPTSFTDLTEDWYKGYVKYLQNSDIIAGTSATTFAPNETVTGVEAAKMMLVAAGYTPDKAGLTGLSWRVNTMRYANANSLFADVNCDINSGLPRQYAAQILYNSLDMENVVYSKDIEGFKPATDVNEDRTIGGKYMDLTTYEGVLEGSGEFGASNEKIAMEVRKVDGRDYTDKDGETTTYDESFNYAEDLTALVGQYVKVTTGKNDKVYGVFAVSSENTVVTAAFSDVKLTSDGSKVKVNGTEYKYESDASVYNAGADTTLVKIENLKTDSYNSADTITFISNDGDAKFDLAIVNPMTAFGKVTYVGDDEVTAAGDTFKTDESIIPSDLAKDDYVAVYTDAYTGNDMLVKADKISGKITGTKGSPVTDVKIDGEWYKLAAGDGASFTGMIGIKGKTATLDGTYDLYCIDGVAYYVDEKQAGSTDTAYVLQGTNSFDADGNYQTKMLFADGSTKVVGANENSYSFTGKLVTYEIKDGAYELKAIADADNMAGGDSVETLSTGFVKDSKKLDNTYRVSDSAIVYVVYKDGGDKQKVITGAELNALSDDFGGAGGDLAVIDDGLATVVLLKDSSYLPGANADKLYGYITSDVVVNKEDNVTYRSFTVWTTNDESVDVKYKNTTVTLDKGDLISFELTSDNYIESVKAEQGNSDNKLVVVGPEAIKDFTSAWVSFYNGGDYDLDDDVKYLSVNNADNKGVPGAALSKASQTANANEYYANAKYVLNDDGDKIVLIVIDSKNKWDADEIVTVSP